MGRTLMTFLSRDECLELLATVRIGRVAVTLDGVPHVVPVNFALLDGDVVFRSGAGTKLHAALDGRPVSFEVDRLDEETRTGWSVLVSGRSAPVSDPEALERVERLDLEAWDPGTKDAVVRVRAELVTGRRIVAA
jgi:nitroimidazol reductase NimA-like FMN-containing flavoprotein (pyridoxamine 5'-phosphate oxidase superfamily)